MPGGENPVWPPNPDAEAEVDIVAQAITDWFGVDLARAGVYLNEIPGCAANAVEALWNRRQTLAEGPELPPFVARHIQHEGAVVPPDTSPG